MIQFTNKTITAQPTPVPITINSPISKRISSNLWLSFSNLNFAGVYRIGSETDKRMCYIGSSYNLTLKITHHLNLLYRGIHHSKELQDWVNINGLESVDVSVLKQTSNNPDEFENWEQYFLDTIKPKFNAVLNKKVVKYEVKQNKRNAHYIGRAVNLFGNPIVSKFNNQCSYTHVSFKVDKETDEERRYWKPDIITIENDEVVRVRGDISTIPKKINKFVSDKEVTEITIVRRNLGFIGR